MQRAITILIVVFLLGGGYYLLTQSNSQPPQESGEVSNEMPAQVGDDVEEMIVVEESATPEPAVSEVKSFTVEGKNFSFAPSAMTVKKGDTVRVTFKNVGGFHDFTLDEFRAQTKTINTGEEATVEFVADMSGMYEFYCSVGNHRQLGMRGTLTVIE